MTARADLLADMLDMARNLVADLEALLRDELGAESAEEDRQQGEEIAAEIAAGVPQPSRQEVEAKFHELVAKHVAPPAVDRQLARARMAVARVQGAR